jgi:hypothetical protein
MLVLFYFETDTFTWIFPTRVKENHRTCLYDIIVQNFMECYEHECWPSRTIILKRCADGTNSNNYIIIIII